MSTHAPEQFDVIVIGGGPGGSTVSTLVARRGHKVLLLERESFPRYSIGESLLPATVHGICKILGVKEAVEAAGFVRKHGGCWRWGKNPDVWTFSFNDDPVTREMGGYAYQVERSKFDQILLDNARKSGVDVREQHSVDALLSGDGRVRGVVFRDAMGTSRAAYARYVIDASGNTSPLHKKVGERVFSPFFQNVAVFGYFENGKRMPAPHAGSIFTCAFDEGWFWYIPLSATLTSVGAVIDKKHAARLSQGGPQEALMRLIASSPHISDMLKNAKRVTEGPYGAVRVRKDYSYSNSRFWIPGLALVGDAACFVDPLFSSGVHLSTYSALLAARSINSCLAGEVDEARSFGEFEGRYRREFNRFYTFLAAFYDFNKDENTYFWEARQVLNTADPIREAFVRLVSGMGSQLPDGITMTFTPEHGNMPTGTTVWDESKAILELARDGEARGEKPSLDGGLVGSRDGLSWGVAEVQA